MYDFKKGRVGKMRYGRRLLPSNRFSQRKEGTTRYLHENMTRKHDAFSHLFATLAQHCLLVESSLNANKNFVLTSQNQTVPASSGKQSINIVEVSLATSTKYPKYTHNKVFRPKTVEDIILPILIVNFIGEMNLWYRKFDDTMAVH